MNIKKKDCGCKGEERCEKCRKGATHSNVYMKENNYFGMDKYAFKLHDKDHCIHPKPCGCHHNDCECDHHKKHHCDKCKKDDCCECHECCEEPIIIYDCDEKECRKCHKKEVKGLNLCRKKVDFKCFKHCSPISQPCDCIYYNQFTSRANLEFSGLVVVKNTGNTSNGCSMKVCVSDRAGTAVVATVNPGSSVPVFVEGLTSLEIACFQPKDDVPCSVLCVGEIIFDLEYCTIKYVKDDCEEFC
ncbi:S-Ena type endospore appendage [Mangrovibacillus cuniculi]|uniref:Endospore appendages core domain-containing protein n=1 Tax=Mangrovibacillus cuniculi TaxID=2593652 RepID=A0A7S8CED2_9BACI|nr:S-Ena type endospore appendage [Mangrovibacillus cuniculi]QPC48268.1 hypothetical protein G8O30_15740 [Mangrovibacillus cuniculi]